MDEEMDMMMAGMEGMEPAAAPADDNKSAKTNKSKKTV